MLHTLTDSCRPWYGPERIAVEGLMERPKPEWRSVFTVYTRLSFSRPAPKP